MKWIFLLMLPATFAFGTNTLQAESAWEAAKVAIDAGARVVRVDANGEVYWFFKGAPCLPKGASKKGGTNVMRDGKQIAVIHAYGNDDKLFEVTTPITHASQK